MSYKWAGSEITDRQTDRQTIATNYYNPWRRGAPRVNNLCRNCWYYSPNLIRSAPKYRSTNDETPLHFVAFGGSIEIAQILLNEGAEVNPLSNKYTVSYDLHMSVYTVRVINKVDHVCTCTPVVDTIGVRAWFVSGSCTAELCIYRRNWCVIHLCECISSHKFVSHNYWPLFEVCIIPIEITALFEEIRLSA